LTGLVKENIQFPWTNRKNTVSDVSLLYFKNVDREKIEQLFDIYRIAFEMFGYQAGQYLSMDNK
jgi:hypothetical protein